jgi:hypothetical protein
MDQRQQAAWAQIEKHANDFYERVMVDCIESKERDHTAALIREAIVAASKAVMVEEA